MIEYILWAFGILFLGLVLASLFPLIYLIPLKLRLGDQAALRYYPMIGSGYYF